MNETPHVEMTPGEQNGEGLAEESQRLIDEALEGVVEPGQAEAGGEAEGEGEGQALTDEDVGEVSTWCANFLSDELSATHPALVEVYDQQTRQRLANSLAPVIRKYGGDLPPWLKPWMPEIMLGITALSIGRAHIAAVRAYNKEQEDEQGGQQDAA